MIHCQTENYCTQNADISTNVVIKIENKCDRAEKSLFMFFNLKKQQQFM